MYFGASAVETPAPPPVLPAPLHSIEGLPGALGPAWPPGPAPAPAAPVPGVGAPPPGPEADQVPPQGPGPEVPRAPLGGGGGGGGGDQRLPEQCAEGAACAEVVGAGAEAESPVRTSSGPQSRGLDAFREDLVAFTAYR